MFGHHEKSGCKDARGCADVVGIVAVTTGADYVALSRDQYVYEDIGPLGHTIPDLHGIDPLYEHVVRQLW